MAATAKRVLPGARQAQIVSRWFRVTALTKKPSMEGKHGYMGRLGFGGCAPKVITKALRVHITATRTAYAVRGYAFLSLPHRLPASPAAPPGAAPSRSDFMRRISTLASLKTAVGTTRSNLTTCSKHGSA